MQYANIFKHLKTITEHKLAVMELCFRVGLIKQGLLHDLSKYSPEEFITGIYFYQGTRSPNAAEKMVRGYSVAWLHHKGRNKHHFEYWIDYAIDPTEGLVGMKMPLRYVLEMCCDRIAASKVYNKGHYTTDIPWNYYQRTEKLLLIHPDTKKLLEKILLINKDQGEERAIAFMRWMLRRPERY
jgi:hypothetical protein